jgi:hypothetical protein
VLDCFKFRNKVGVDVAVEALGDYRGASSICRENTTLCTGLLIFERTEPNRYRALETSASYWLLEQNTWLTSEGA